MVGRSTQASRFSGPPAADDRVVELVDQERRRARRVRVGVEHHRVAARHHADAVVDDRLGRVGGRRDRSDDAVAGAARSSSGRRRPRRRSAAAASVPGVLSTHSSVLLHLVLDAAVAGLLDRVASPASAPRLRAVSRMASTQRLRASSGAASFASCARRAAFTAASTSANTPRRPRGMSTSRRARGGARRRGARRQVTRRRVAHRLHRRLRQLADPRDHAVDDFLDARLVHAGDWTLTAKLHQGRRQWRSGSRPRTWRPRTLEALLAHARALVGVELGELADALGLPVPVGRVRTKGWSGQVIEHELGVGDRRRARPRLRGAGRRAQDRARRRRRWCR